MALQKQKAPASVYGATDIHVHSAASKVQSVTRAPFELWGLLLTCVANGFTADTK